jgi:hypothetical protein
MLISIGRCNLYMLDAIYVGLAFGSFIALALYVVGCEKL